MDDRAHRQANVPASLGDLSARFWALTAVTGVAAGLGAVVMMAVLRTVQHAAFGYHEGEYSSAAAARGDLRLLLVVVGGGVIAGAGWWALRRYAGGNGGSPTRAVWTGTDDLSPSRTLVSGALSEVVIGMGASLGREAAPQHLAAACAAWLGRRLRLPHDQRMLLIACGAGAGVGSVYNVPLAGALFAAELYMGSITATTVVPALVTAAIATAVGWIWLPTSAIYHVPTLAFPSASLLVWAVLAGPVIGAAAAAFVKLIAWASDHRPTGRGLLVQPPAAFAVLAALALAYPLLLGNGRDLAQWAFDGGGAIGTLAVLALLKPVVTALCLRSGASGGLFTPTLSTGAILGALLGHAWSLLWPGTAPAAFAIVGAAAMLAAGMQAPLAAIAFTLELTNSVNASVVAIVLAIGGALLAARWLEPRSIYSARLPLSRSRPPRHRHAAEAGSAAGAGRAAGRHRRGSPTAGRHS